MLVSIVGTGYVGLVTGTCLASQGHEVVCFDSNPEIVEKLRAGTPTIYEAGLEELLEQAVVAGRLRFESDFANGLAAAEVVFLAVGTPKQPDSDGVDMRYIDAAVRGIAPHLRDGTIVILKSTVPPGTNRRVASALARLRPDIDVPVASNPEFLREGSAILDFFNAERVVCGIRDEATKPVLAGLYQALIESGTTLVFTTPEDAELSKYASNAFLAMKITFINEIADLCEAIGANAGDIAVLMGMDSRIGPAFLKAGPGYGGSCFPKDTMGLLSTARSHGVASRLVETTAEVNEWRKRHIAHLVAEAVESNGADRTVAVLGVAFKADTDDVRDAPALAIIPQLQLAGITVQAYDPMGRRNAEGLLPGVVWFDDAIEALRNADAAVILTEWSEFSRLRASEIAAAMRGRHVFDVRNVLSEEVRDHPRLAYRGIGSTHPSPMPLQLITAGQSARYGRRKGDVAARIRALDEVGHS